MSFLTQEFKNRFTFEAIVTTVTTTKITFKKASCAVDFVSFNQTVSSVSGFYPSFVQWGNEWGLERLYNLIWTT